MWGMYFNGAMTQQENNEQKMKNIMVKGNKGVISYDANKGYTVVVMLTQGSALTWEGVNYASEQEMLDAVNKFDIDKIKDLLGEK
jgi:predicted regulator of Ras-like GTPase activity (Roadblock/LC7/MglB family)